MRQIRADPTPLRRHRLTGADVANCQRNLESTYIVRLFAELEAALRTFWKHVKKPSDWPRIHVRALIANVAARQLVSPETLARANEVRQCRNRLVHERPTGPVLTLAECRSHLCRFLSFLPHLW